MISNLGMMTWPFLSSSPFSSLILKHLNIYLFAGLGLSITLLAYIGFLYYMVILAWVLYFVAMCFMPILPWTTCDNSWNTISCLPLFTETDENVTNLTSMATSSNVSGYLATEEFWRSGFINETAKGTDVT